MFNIRTINNKIVYMKSVLDGKPLSFEKLLEIDGSVSIHRRNL